MNITAIRDHLTRFGEAIFAVEGQCLRFQSAGKLLLYAGGIEGVNYSAASEAGMFCSGVAEVERQQEAVVAPFLHAQAVFTVAWMALESLIDEINPPGPTKLGKIGRLCHYLQLEKDAIAIPAGYADFVNKWTDLERELDTDYGLRCSVPPQNDPTMPTMCDEY